MSFLFDIVGSLGLGSQLTLAGTLLVVAALLGVRPWADMSDQPELRGLDKVIDGVSKAEIKKIQLGIDKQTKNIYNLIQTQDNGTKITITVSSFKTNQPIPESLFEFKENRYKDYYINRLD